MPNEADPDRIVLKARSQLPFPVSTRVRYGIESYFVPEGQGRRLEALAQREENGRPRCRRCTRQRRASRA